MQDAIFSDVDGEGLGHSMLPGCNPAVLSMSYDGFPVFSDGDQVPSPSSFVQSDYNEERGMGFFDDCCAVASSSFPSFTEAIHKRHFPTTKHTISASNGGLTDNRKQQALAWNEPPQVPDCLGTLHFVTSCIVSDVRMTIDQYIKNKPGVSAQYKGNEWTWTVSFQKGPGTNCAFTIRLYVREDERDARQRKCVVELYQTAGDKLFFATTIVPDIGERLQYLR